MRKRRNLPGDGEKRPPVRGVQALRQHAGGGSEERAVYGEGGGVVRGLWTILKKRKINYAKPNR